MEHHTNEDNDCGGMFSNLKETAGTLVYASEQSYSKQRYLIQSIRIGRNTVLKETRLPICF